MRALQNLFEQDWLRGVLYTFIAAGLIIALFGGWGYISNTLELRSNLAYQVRQSDEAYPIESADQAPQLFSSDLQRREILRDRWTAIIIAGAGIAVLSVGWIGLNVANDIRSKKSVNNTPSHAAE